MEFSVGRDAALRLTEQDLLISGCLVSQVNQRVDAIAALIAPQTCLRFIGPEIHVPHLGRQEGCTVFGQEEAVRVRREELLGFGLVLVLIDPVVVSGSAVDLGLPGRVRRGLRLKNRTAQHVYQDIGRSGVQ